MGRNFDLDIAVGGIAGAVTIDHQVTHLLDRSLETQGVEVGGEDSLDGGVAVDIELIGEYVSDAVAIGGINPLHEVVASVGGHIDAYQSVVVVLAGGSAGDITHGGVVAADGKLILVGLKGGGEGGVALNGDGTLGGSAVVLPLDEAVVQRVDGDSGEFNLGAVGVATSGAVGDGAVAGGRKDGEGHIVGVDIIDSGEVGVAQDGHDEGVVGGDNLVGVVLPTLPLGIVSGGSGGEGGFSTIAVGAVASDGGAIGTGNGDLPLVVLEVGG